MGESVGSNEALTKLPAAIEKWRANTLGRVTDELERELILSLIGPAAGLRIFDIGCGDGGLLKQHI